MLTTQKPSRIVHGPPYPRNQARALDIAGTLSRIQGGRGAMWSPVGMSLAPANTDIRIGQTQSGGISARSGTTLGSGTITDAYLVYNTASTSTIGLASTEFTAFNFAASPIGDTAVKYVICRTLWGIWVVISAEC